MIKPGLIAFWFPAISSIPLIYGAYSVHMLMLLTGDYMYSILYVFGLLVWALGFAIAVILSALAITIITSVKDITVFVLFIISPCRL